MNELHQMLRDHATDAETPPIRNPQQLVKAATIAARGNTELRAAVRNIPIGSIANLAAEMDGVADILRRGAQSLRDAAAGELRRKDHR